MRADTAKLVNRFSTESLIATGALAPNLDYTGLADEAALRARLEADPLGRKFLTTGRMNDVLRFLFEIAVGDVVVTPTAGSVELLLRIVKTPYEYVRKDPDNMHMQRRVAPGMRLAVPAAKREQFPRQPKGTIFPMTPEQVEAIKQMLVKAAPPAATDAPAAV